MEIEFGLLKRGDIFQRKTTGDILYKKRNCSCGGKNTLVVATDEKIKVSKKEVVIKYVHTPES